MRQRGAPPFSVHRQVARRSQGLEGGGHNRSVATTFTLLPAIRAAVAPIPVIAAGGVTDGASMAAALALGAEAVWCGTRFLASREADAHDGYKARVLAAGVADTLSTTLFGPEMPLQPMRVIRNAATDEWAGREREAMAATAGQTAGTLRRPDGDVPLPRFSVHLPTRDVDGDLDQLCLTAGQSAGRIRDLKPAAVIVDEMTREALAAIAALAARAGGAAAPGDARRGQDAGTAPARDIDTGAGIVPAMTDRAPTRPPAAPGPAGPATRRVRGLARRAREARGHRRPAGPEGTVTVQLRTRSIRGS